jgi:hypothetical protein
MLFLEVDHLFAGVGEVTWYGWKPYTARFIDFETHFTTTTPPPSCTPIIKFKVPMEPTNRQFPFERGSPNRRSPPPLAVAAENVSPIDVTMFARLKSPPDAASAAPLTSTRSADYHPITPQRVSAPKGVPGVGSKSAEHPGMSADVTPTPVPVVLPILPEDKLPSSRPRKKRRERKIKPSISSFPTS